MDVLWKEYVSATKYIMDAMASLAGKLHNEEGPGQFIALKGAAKICQTRAGELTSVLMETLEVQQKFEQEMIAFKTTVNQNNSGIKQLERENLKLTHGYNDIKQ